MITDWLELDIIVLKLSRVSPGQSAPAPLGFVLEQRGITTEADWRVRGLVSVVMTASTLVGCWSPQCVGEVSRAGVIRRVAGRVRGWWATKGGVGVVRLVERVSPQWHRGGGGGHSLVRRQVRLAAHLSSLNETAVPGRERRGVRFPMYSSQSYRPS